MSTVEQTVVPGPGVEVTTGRRRTLALAIVALAFVMDLLDNTIVNIAIPSIRADLGATYADVQWLSAGYALAFAVLLITGGRLGDVVGYKRLFLVGVIGFTLASLVSGLAWSTEVLVAARLLQGATAALMAPQVISLMQVMYKPSERAAVMGVFGALGGLAASLGPIVGGLLIQWDIAGLDWRPIFLMNVPIGVFAVVAGLRYLPEGRSPHPLRLDLLGTVLVVVALGLLVFPLIQGRDLDWPLWVFGMMVASIPVFAAFWLWQLRKQRIDGSPLVIPALLRIGTFRTGAVINIVFAMLLQGFFFAFTLVLQLGPGLMALGLGGVLVVLLLARRETNGWALAPGLLVVGLGMGLTMGLFFSVTLKDVDPGHAGSASGTLSALQQVGGAIGIALLGVVFFGGLTQGAGASFDAVAPQVRAQLVAAGVPEAAAGPAVRAVRTCYVDRAA